MTYFAYLDQFGHVGPYVARPHPKFRESPVFDLAIRTRLCSHRDATN